MFCESCTHSRAVVAAGASGRDTDCRGPRSLAHRRTFGVVDWLYFLYLRVHGSFSLCGVTIIMCIPNLTSSYDQ